MKTIKLILATILLTSGLISCSDENDDDTVIDDNPLADYNLLTTMGAEAHTIEIYSEQDQFTVGYNELFLRIKENATDSYVPDAEVSWMPLMNMAEMQHSCPRSSVSISGDDAVYTGFIIFQMAGNDTEYWEITIDYDIDGIAYSVTEELEVNMPVDENVGVTVFTGSDETRYVLAMMPFEPEVAVNDFSAILYKMDSMMAFSLVEDFSIEIDPRMPSMGNHTSPNNVDLAYDAYTNLYTGQLSLTMTGYWKINLKVRNVEGDVLKGEDVTDDNEASSIYFELEF